MIFTFNPMECAENERKRINKKIDATNEEIHAINKENEAIKTMAKFFEQNVKLPISNPNRIKEDDLQIVADYLWDKTKQIGQRMNALDIEEMKIQADKDKLKAFCKGGE